MDEQRRNLNPNYPVTVRSSSSSTSSTIGDSNKSGFRKFTKSLTLFIPSYEEAAADADTDAASASCTTNQLSSSTMGSGSNSHCHLPISSPDSAFHTGSEFNTTEDSFDPNSHSTRNDKVEHWVKTTANAAAAHAHGQMDPHIHAHAHIALPLSSDDYEDILSAGSLCSSIRPGKIVIEESVEEIITHSNSLEESDPENASSDPELNPEDSSTEEDEFGSGSLADGALDGEISTHPPLTWEYNWLFKKKKFIIGRGKNGTSGAQKFRTTMFIPNPMNYEEASCQYFPNEEELEENEDLSLESRETESEEDDETESEAEDEVTVRINPEIKPNFDRKLSLESPIQNQKPIASSRKIKPVVDSPLIRIPTQFYPNSPEPESIEETMRETSRSLIASNDTIEYQSPSQPKIIEPVAKVKVNGTATAIATTLTSSTDSSTSSITNENKSVPEKEPIIGSGKVEMTNALLEEIPEEPNSSPPPPTPSTLAEMRIAEREKQKWNNPVKISNNPYSPESLLRRISNNSFLQCNETLGGKVVVDDPDPDPADFRSSTHDLSSNQKILRDYYVNLGDTKKKSRSCISLTNGSNSNGYHTRADVKVNLNKIAATNQTGVGRTEKIDQRPKAKVIPLVTFSNATSTQRMEPLQLPSVRNLAEKFRTDELSTPTIPPPQVISDHKPRPLPRKTFDSSACAMKQIHSLTARSVPKQFREDLRLAKPPMSNVNIKSSTKTNN